VRTPRLLSSTHFLSISIFVLIYFLLPKISPALFFLCSYLLIYPFKLSLNKKIMFYLCAWFCVFRLRMEMSRAKDMNWFLLLLNIFLLLHLHSFASWRFISLSTLISFSYFFLLLMTFLRLHFFVCNHVRE
jgi:hypothetical protein